MANLGERSFIIPLTTFNEFGLGFPASKFIVSVGLSRAVHELNKAPNSSFNSSFVSDSLSSVSASDAELSASPGAASSPSLSFSRSFNTPAVMFSIPSSVNAFVISSDTEFKNLSASSKSIILIPLDVSNFSPSKEMSQLAVGSWVPWLAKKSNTPAALEDTLEATEDDNKFCVSTLIPSETSTCFSSPPAFISIMFCKYGNDVSTKLSTIGPIIAC